MQMKRREFIKGGLSLATLLPLLSLAKSEGKPAPDVLVLSVDDLRPQLGCYGVDWMKTPNLDALARESMVFEHAYCQQAVCLPSRASLWSGLRPDTVGITNLKAKIRKSIPSRDLIFQVFEKNGYHTVGMGKILHDERTSEWNEWIDIRKNYGIKDYVSDEALDGIKELSDKSSGTEEKVGAEGPRIKWNATESVDKPDEAFHDGMMTRVAMDYLEQNALKADKPLFLALGYLKPHLPFSAPKKYWDLYDRASLPLAPNPFFPKDMPEVAKTTYGELRAYVDIAKKEDLSEEKTRELIHGYVACVSFLDAQIGKVVSKLKALGRWDNTIVVLFGDHGWKLGEHLMWAKHTDFEIDLNAPLILKGAGGLGAGKRCSALVEFVDVMPTLCDLANLPKPPSSVEGKSLKPLLENPLMPWSEYAFSQWEARGGKTMGYSLRNQHFRFTEWIDVASRETEALELYDHDGDPQENENVAKAPAHQVKVKEFRDVLRRAFTKMSVS